MAGFLKQVLREIQRTKTRSLRTQYRTAPRHAFARQHTRVILARKLLIHTIQEPYLTTAYTYVTRRDILVGADAAPQF